MMRVRGLLRVLTVHDYKFMSNTQGVCDLTEAVSAFVEAVQGCESIDVLGSILQSSVAKFGFRCFAYLIVNLAGHVAHSGWHPILLSNYPRNWTKCYLERSYHLTDPLVIDAGVQRTPFRWGPGAEYRKLGPEEKHVMKEAAAQGLTRGLAIPIHGPGKEIGLFTVASEHSARDLDALLETKSHALQLIGLYTHATVVERITPNLEVIQIRLTAKEKEVLFWTGQGKTSNEVSKILYRSEATVNYHLQRAMQKLNAVNKCQAVVKATTSGLIHF